MTTHSTSQATLNTSTDLAAFRDRIVGEILTPGSAPYDAARALTNFTFDRHPALIVRVANTRDVVEAVRYATARGLQIAVKSGGHSVAGQSGIDDGLTIDFGAMKGAVIDPVSKTARVQPGVTSGDLAGPAHAYGLALTTGDTGSVALGGLVTGGGIGFMSRKYGLTIDSLLSVEVVTATGDVLRASASENTDLFWAVRGGGGNFGIVTEFEFRLASVGSILGGALVLPATPEVIRGHLDYIVNAPDELTTIANLMHAPPAPFIPEDRLGELVLMVLITYAGDAEAGNQAIAPLRALAEPVADAVAEIPYPVMYAFTEASTQRHGAIIRTTYAQTISDQAIADVIAAMNVATSPMSMIQFRGLGGAISRVPADATAYAHRDANYFIAALGLWLDPEDARETHEAWMVALWSKLSSLGSGAYVNFLGNEGEARIREAYPPATYARLAEVKRRYDPENVFRLNQNIKPA